MRAQIYTPPTVYTFVFRPILITITSLLIMLISSSHFIFSISLYYKTFFHVYSLLIPGSSYFYCNFPRHRALCHYCSCYSQSFLRTAFHSYNSMQKRLDQYIISMATNNRLTLYMLLSWLCNS